MFYNFNYDNFPIVNIKFNGYIDNDYEFNLFLNEWENIYNRKQNFELVFDTENLSGSKIKYTFYMAFFIRKLKKKNLTYLQKSKIIFYNKYLFNLAKFIFYLEKPIADVHLILNNYNNCDYWIYKLDEIK